MRATPSADGPVLVTGGTGFLGRRLVERLLRHGRQVSVLSRRSSPDLVQKGVVFHEASLTDQAAVARACEGQATIFHVAAQVGVWGPDKLFFETNVLGTRAVIAGARAAGVPRIVHTSTPSVVYNGQDLAGADESLPYTNSCPSPYPTTKAIAESEVLAASGSDLKTVALRPHLVWGIGDPHLVPRLLARHDRLRIIGDGRNRVDMVHVENAVDAHLLAEQAVDSIAAGKAYFITNGEPVLLWDWINQLYTGLGLAPIKRKLPLGTAAAVGAVLEAAWRLLPLKGEPPMTRFVAAELAKDHWFSIVAARRDLGYEPKISMAEGTAELIASLRTTRAA